MPWRLLGLLELLDYIGQVAFSSAPRMPQAWLAARDALELEASPTDRTPVRFTGAVERVQVELMYEAGALPGQRGTTVIRTKTALPTTVNPASDDGGVSTGDIRFDARFAVQGDPFRAAAWLGPSEREALSTFLSRTSGTRSVEQEGLAVRLTGLCEDASWMVRTVRELVALERTLQSERTELERLSRRMVTEPRWQTRCFVLDVLAEHTPSAGHTPILTAALQDASAQVRDRAAVLLGREDLRTSLEPGQLSLVEAESGAVSLLKPS